MPMPGCESSSKALRRWPSLLSAEPVPRGLVGGERYRARKRACVRERRHLRAVAPLPVRSHTANRNAFGGQPLVGIIGAQRQPILRARGEHPIGLGDSARHQVVDHHRQIAFGAVESDGPSPAGSRRRVQACHQALRRRFLVAGGAVDLPGEEQPRQAPGLQCRMQLARIDMVVFDGIARPDDAHVLQPRNGGDQRLLHLFAAARSRYRWDRRWCRRALRAREKSGAPRAPRNGRSCPRSKGNSAAPGSRSGRNTSGNGARCRE